MPPNDVLSLPESNPTGTQVDDGLREVRVPLQVRGDTAGMRQPEDGLHLCSTDQVIRVHLLPHIGQSRKIDRPMLASSSRNSGAGQAAVDQLVAGPPYALTGVECEIGGHLPRPTVHGIATDPLPHRRNDHRCGFPPAPRAGPQPSIGGCGLPQTPRNCRDLRRKRPSSSTRIRGALLPRLLPPAGATGGTVAPRAVAPPVLEELPTHLGSAMARPPRRKRNYSADGSMTVAAKNPNGTGSVFYEPPSVRPDGRERAGRWRATYVDADGKVHRVNGATRSEVEARRDERLAEIRNALPAESRFDGDTTVSELLDWWLDTIARHQVKTSTLDSYRRFAGYLTDGIGARRIVDVDAEVLAAWQSKLLDSYAPYTVLNCRKVCRQAFLEAMKLGLIHANPFDLVKAPRGKAQSARRALPAAEAKRLVAAAGDVRYGAAVTLLFCQGWRVSEVLGLAWEDLDLDAGTARIRRGAAYTPSAGMVLGTTKTAGAQGVHHLAPTAVERLRLQREKQQLERECCDEEWPSHTFDGQTISLVFTNQRGGLVNRQAIVKDVERAAKKAGIDPAGLATHTGRRTVITALYAAGDLDLADVARHVGHSDTKTTAGYVRDLGQRPADTARKAAQLLDPSA